MVVSWSLSDTKSTRVSRTLLRILGDINNIVVWMVPTRLLISKSSSPYTTPSVIVPNASITVSITVTFLFHRLFFSFLARSWHLSFFLFSFNFILWLAGTAKSTISFLLLIVIRSGRLAEYYNYYYYYYLLFWKFFSPVLADGFLLEFEWQQVFSNLQDSSRYSDCFL